MSYLYVGVDLGRKHHHIAVVDDHGTLVSSERVANDHAHLQAVIRQICHRRRNIRWAVDILQAAKTYGTCASDGRYGFLDASLISRRLPIISL